MCYLPGYKFTVTSETNLSWFFYLLHPTVNNNTDTFIKNKNRPPGNIFTLTSPPPHLLPLPLLPDYLCRGVDRVLFLVILDLLSHFPLYKISYCVLLLYRLLHKCPGLQANYETHSLK